MRMAHGLEVGAARMLAPAKGAPGLPVGLGTFRRQQALELARESLEARGERFPVVAHLRVNTSSQ
ncbi:hypothetical protein D3C83_308410 [compost metagenome]